jgi:hypothetical protein
MSSSILLKRDTAANFLTSNRLLLQGEMGLEIDTHKLKIGDGITHWNSLAYFGYYSSNFGNLTTSTGSVINITGGNNSVLGSGVNISINTASGTVTGVLSSSDWTIFNNKYNGLPSQSGKVGKFLKSNGVNESWEDLPSTSTGSIDKSFIVAMSVGLGG